MKIQLIVHIVCVLAVSLTGQVNCCADDGVCCTNDYPPEGAAVGNRSYCSTQESWCRTGYELIGIDTIGSCHWCCKEYTKTSDSDNCVRSYELCPTADSVCCKTTQKCYSYEGDQAFCIGG